MNYSELIHCQDARTFLKKALEIYYHRRGKVNMADFSRKAGFASRSFLAEYLAGKKNLSRESLSQLKAALRLPRDYARLFAALVYAEQPELSPEFNSAAKPGSQAGTEIKNIAEELRHSLLKKEKTLGEVRNSDGLVAKRSLFRIFAALGNESEGASLSEICQRTGLPLEEIREGLQALLEHNVISFRQQRFFVHNHQVDFLKLGTPELSQLTRDVCMEIRREADKLVGDDKSFVFYSALSVQSQQLPLFKEKLREAIYGVLDQFQNDNGDAVQQVFFCSKN